MPYTCNRCDEPIRGSAVAEGYCTRCLMGTEHEECELCGGPMEVGNEDSMCESCQETIDCATEAEDYPIFGADDEEFLRGPTF